MKKPAVIKNMLMASLLIAGMQLWTSCNGCSRKGGSGEGTQDGVEANGDTRGSDSPTDNEGSGSTEGTGPESGGSSNSSDARNTSNNNTASGLTQEEIDAKIENSSSTSKDANGMPINSGGTSGTGTGSTGNNSKVTRPEDQKGN